MLPEHQLYELINQLQRTILFEEQFSFIHEALLNYFPQLPDNNSEFENGSYFVNYKFIETPIDFEQQTLPDTVRRTLKTIDLNSSYKDEFS